MASKSTEIFLMLLLTNDIRVLPGTHLGHKKTGRNHHHECLLFPLDSHFEGQGHYSEENGGGFTPRTKYFQVKISILLLNFT